MRPLADVRTHEVGAPLAAFALFFCLLASYYLLRPLRDAMGLVGGTGNLPWLFTATFGVMMLGVPAFGALAFQLVPRRFVPDAAEQPRAGAERAALLHGDSGQELANLQVGAI